VWCTPPHDRCARLSSHGSHVGHNCSHLRSSSLHTRSLHSCIIHACCVRPCTSRVPTCAGATSVVTPSPIAASHVNARARRQPHARPLAHRSSPSPACHCLCATAVPPPALACSAAHAAMLGEPADARSSGRCQHGVQQVRLAASDDLGAAMRMHEWRRTQGLRSHVSCTWGDVLHRLTATKGVWHTSQTPSPALGPEAYRRGRVQGPSVRRGFRADSEPFTKRSESLH
jgi:hypothetical protein